MPRTAAAQFAAARKVEPELLRAGDLVFFRLVPGSREVTHVGIYTGPGMMIDSPRTGKATSEPLESLCEELLDVEGLEPLGSSPFHLDSQFVDVCM